MKSKLSTHAWCLFPVFMLVLSSFLTAKSVNESSFATIKLIFKNIVKNRKIVLNDSTYTNPFGESYTISKLRYYITNVTLHGNSRSAVEKESYHLVDASNTETQVVTFSVPAATYDGISFLLGVDSLHNVSGAQTGDLDPAKDMFWTWNSGYVMAKMEGNSPASTLVNHKFEFHIGGFSGSNSVLKDITLDFPKPDLSCAAGKTYDIIINADINSWWQNPHDVKIAEHANVTSPGQSARDISDNYASMFHIEKIIAE